MSDMIYEPFGEAVPVDPRTTTDDAPASGTGHRLYKTAIIAFWLLVAVIVIARVSFHGNIFTFGT